MSADSRRYALNVSESFFRLTTETLRLHSNETFKYQTLASLVNARAAAASKLDQHNPTTLKALLATIPPKGDIRIYLNITKATALSLSNAKKHLAKTLGSSMTLSDFLAILLFDYVIEKKSVRVMQRLKLPGAPGLEVAIENAPQ